MNSSSLQQEDAVHLVNDETNLHLLNKKALSIELADGTDQVIYLEQKIKKVRTCLKKKQRMCFSHRYYINYIIHMLPIYFMFILYRYCISFKRSVGIFLCRTNGIKKNRPTHTHTRTQKHTNMHTDITNITDGANVNHHKNKTGLQSI